MTIFYGDDGANLWFDGAGNDTFYGYGGDDTIYAESGGNDVLYGGAGNDWLEGGAGADKLYGGDGIDTISYNLSGAGVHVAIGGTGSGGEAQGDVIGADVENISASQHDDVLVGSAAANSLLGLGGNDNLSGLGGNDVLDGGDGNDVVRGGAGADQLNGGLGIDTVTYSDSTVGVTVNLLTLTGQGGDAQGDNISNFENVTGGQGNDTLLGSSRANTLIGSNGDDVLRGAGGADHLDGSAGFDTAVYSESTIGVTISLTTGTGSGGNAQGDVLTSIESVIGGTGNDVLIGSSHADTLSGNFGNDVIRGDGGHDTLSGGGGADRFVYDNLGDSPANANADRITDFNHGQGDRIDLHLIDANSTVAGDQAFHFIGSAAFGHHAGELRAVVSTTGATTVVTADIDGDGSADVRITLSGSITLQAADFVL